MVCRRCRSKGRRCALSRARSNSTSPPEARAVSRAGRRVQEARHGGVDDRAPESESVAELARAMPETIVASDDPATLQVKDPFLADRPDGGCCSSSAATRSIGRRPTPASWRSVPTASRAAHRASIAIRGDSPGTSRSRAEPASCRPGATRAVRHRPRVLQRRRVPPEPRGARPGRQAAAGLLLRGTRRIGLLRERGPDVVSAHLHDLPGVHGPDGTHCLRYVDVLATDDAYIATWQQSAPTVRRR